uniref:Uncharacterized protein n=1 Tax=Anguilla anguilla TaxID=7936 RepID=A0A0E9XTF1_ANGAN
MFVFQSLRMGPAVLVFIIQFLNSFLVDSHEIFHFFCLFKIIHLLFSVSRTG